jgi:hypothetical protein
MELGVWSKTSHIGTLHTAMATHRRNSVSKETPASRHTNFVWALTGVFLLQDIEGQGSTRCGSCNEVTAALSGLFSVQDSRPKMVSASAATSLYEATSMANRANEDLNVWCSSRWYATFDLFSLTWIWCCNLSTIPRPAFGVIVALAIQCSQSHNLRTSHFERFELLFAYPMLL